jgi:pimeloyl-ACP methyl ester carboxylesterase
MRIASPLAVFVASVLVSIAPGASNPAAQAAEVPRFEPGPCFTDRLPAPIPALENAQCGYLVVPENRSQPNGTTIRLAVAIVPAIAAEPASDPLVHLTGGPGGIAMFDAPALIAAGLNRRRDLILMNQRGTFLSEPALTCTSIDEFNRRLLGLPLDTEETRKKHVAATRRCRRELAARGIDVAAYNTTENAADFADLRRVLGYDRWNLFGVSYGTDLALTILRDHPEGLRSVILDSTVPTGVVTLPGFWPNARDAFLNLFRACEAQADCNASFPQLERTFTDLVRRLEENPVSTTVPDPRSGAPTTVVLDGGALVNWLVSVSLTKGAFDDVPSWIAELAAGDATRIAEFRVSQLTPPGLVAYGLAYSVICREWYPFASGAQVLAEGRDAFPRYPRSVRAEPPQFTYFYDDCPVWNVPPAPASFRVPTVSDVPVLLLSGSFDAITPLAWAYAAAETLPNAKVVSIPGAGHFVAPESTCAQSAIASFLRRPHAPRTDCVAAVLPPPFATP